MEKTEVMIDASFLQKLSLEGKNILDLKKLMSLLNYSLVLHPYTAKYEVDMYEYVQNLIDEGFIRVASYSEFIADSTDRQLYENQFQYIHDQLRKNLELENKHKSLDELNVPVRQTVFTYRKANMSLGDVHMILMAFYTGMPIILSNDSDFYALKEIVANKISNDHYTLVILDSVDILEMVASIEQDEFEKKDLLNILKSIGENKQRNRIKLAWDCAHENEKTTD